ncbi:MAG: penicillin-binding protein [Saprospiraceae bacterium]
MDVKNEVLYRVYFLLFGIVVPAAIILFYRTFEIAVVQGEKWRDKGESNYIKPREVEADRGNILATDGTLLATSVPYFDIYFDPTAPSQENYDKHVDSLAYCLATYVDNTFTVGGFRDYLLELRQDSTNKHVLIKSQVSYTEKKRMEQFPLFNLGQFKGGFIARKRSERKRPFGLLARRTIGYVREDFMPVGIESYFDNVLGGQPGQQFMIRVDPKRDLWVPVEDLTSIEPKSGDDVITTIDVNLQAITENALLRAVQHHDAEWGVAVLMETKTGAIRAIANLGRTDEGWFETYNYAIASATEPGSTFKLASMMALIEDGHVNLDDSLDIQQGKADFFNETMEDSNPFSAKMDTTTVKRAFEISSNVGIAKLIQQYYGEKTKANDNKGAAQFIERLKSFNLHLPTGIELDGEANPLIKEAYSAEDQWSGTTLPWMAIGYECRLTPLQLLTFFNTIANDGQLVKPMLVSEIQRFGKTLETFPTTVVKERIASKRTIEQAKELLEAVVENGTAYKLKTDRYRFAGKTGTAQVNYRRSTSGNHLGGYQASFVGYFPAEAPQYSCIVVINKPRQSGYYGADVAGPVFREIADRCFDVVVNLQKPINRGPRPMLVENTLPSRDIGRRDDMKAILEYLEMPYFDQSETEMAMINPHSDSLMMENRNIGTDKVPNVIGMGLRDALYALENRKLKVQVNGFGKVVSQSLPPGASAKGRNIRINLR